jgi:ribonuclease HII
MTARFDRRLIPARPDLSYEQALWKQGLFLIGGIDEAGRGAWAGPVAAAVVILPSSAGIPPSAEMTAVLLGVRDSKQMSPAQRDFWANKIKSTARAWGVGMASHQEIDSLGIVPATRLAAQRALAQLGDAAEYLLLDYLHLPEVNLPQVALVKGDARVLSIACASVLAKTSRDAVMIAQDGIYPGYGFAHHKGYGTAAHMAALARLGPCPIHRLSFKPVQTVSRSKKQP